MVTEQYRLGNRYQEQPKSSPKRYESPNNHNEYYNNSGKFYQKSRSPHQTYKSPQMKQQQQQIPTRDYEYSNYNFIQSPKYVHNHDLSEKYTNKISPTYTHNHDHKHPVSPTNFDRKINNQNQQYYSPHGHQHTCHRKTVSPTPLTRVCSAKTVKYSDIGNTSSRNFDFRAVIGSPCQR